MTEDSHVNPFSGMEKEKEQMTIDTSGMKLLESSDDFVNQNGKNLAKMLKALLTSKKAWYSEQVQTDLEKEGSKSNVLLFLKPSGIKYWHQRKRVWIIGCNVPMTQHKIQHRERTKKEHHYRWR